MPTTGAPPNTAWIAIPIVLLVLVFRLRGMSRDRRLRVEWLWLMPVMLLAVAGLMLAQFPLAGFDWAWLIPAFALGAVVGFWRGRLTTVTVNPETHALTSRASPAALYLLGGVILLRLGLRYLLEAEASTLHLNAALVTDAFLAFAVGLVAVQRLEVWIRARRLLAEARAAKAAA
ncbi:MAG: hypothetical protein BGN86_02570 [Caulobacterales bacterium 68-7]|nr:MAG: hypothetical protein BGN86_02570 [Caulobacterales bacterium 68-7]